MSSHRPPEEQEQMIRAKKRQLFEADELPTTDAGPRKSFREYVRDTPAAPLSGGAKAALWATGVVVVLILVAAFARPRKPPKLAPRPAGTVAPARPG